MSNKIERRKLQEEADQYEQIVHHRLKDHLSKLADEGAVVIETGLGGSNRIEGESGFLHQIDVSIRYQSKDGTQRLKLVECKHLGNDPVDAEKALTFLGRLYDIQNAMENQEIKVDGNLVTTIGFTAGAHKIAAAYNIATNTAHLNREQGSTTFAEGVIVRLA